MAPGGGAYPPGEHNQPRESSCASSQGCPINVQRAKSLAPPSVVRLNSTHAVLSWRATLGPFSFRSEVEVDAPDSDEWDNLEEDMKRAAGTGLDSAPENVTLVSRAEVLEVDHVELQTCCGCPQCVHGEGGEATAEGESVAPCTCPCFRGRRGLGCWRPVYQGSRRRCQVRLERGSPLHFFRLLVRARRPPPERRGYRRPKQPHCPDATSWRGPTSPPVDGFCFDLVSPEKSPPRRRRRRPRIRQAAAGTDTPTADSPVDPDEAFLPGYTSSYPYPREVGEDGTAVTSRGHGGTGAPAVANGLTDTPARDKAVQWFASDSVFVESCPPAVVLHGIGTALVLTWPPLEIFSGLERVAYIIEQWSHEASAILSSAAGATIDTVAISGNGNGRRPESRSERRNQTDPLGRRRRQPHHRHQHDVTPPKQADSKEVFSVGTRCWFVPTSLQTGRRYWYRLRLVHEGGKSIGGPWVSHATSLAPPRCVDAGARALVLSLPRAIDERRGGEGAGQQAAPGSNSGGEGLKALSDLQSSLVQSPSCPAEDEDGKLRDRETGRLVGVTNDQHSARGGQEADFQKRGTTPPVVWYTLEGLETDSRWAVLYRGPNANVIVKGLQANALAAFRVGVNVDMRELRRQSLGPLASLELESPPSLLSGPTATVSVDDVATTTISPANASLRRTGTPPSNLVRPAFRLKTATTPVPFAAPASGLERETWIPATSPAVSQMKREGFAVHDVTAAVGGGFHSERPSLGRVQGGGDDEETRISDDDADADDDACGGRKGSGKQGCLEYSQCYVFATAPRAPRFAAFIADGSPQVKLWWEAPRNLCAPCRAGHPATAATAAAATATAAAATTAATATAATAVTATTAAAPPVAIDSTAHHRNGRHLTSTETKVVSPVRGRHDAAKAPPQCDDEDDTVPANAPLAFEHPFFSLDVLNPAKGVMRHVRSGPELWADLAMSSGRSTTLASATAYPVRLSSRMASGQPEGSVDGVIVTAPFAPALELLAGTGGGGAGEGGAVSLRASWVRGIDTSLLPPGDSPPTISVALEMAHAWEAGPPTRGLGCALPATFRVASGRVAIASPTGPDALSGEFLTGEARAGEESGEATTAGSKNASSLSTHRSAGAQDVSVKTDTGGGRCWTLGSSSWTKLGCRTDDFCAVWRGSDGETEALTPRLPPGMRFAFRVRVECCFGVAVSAATVYQTATMVPVPPTGLRACLTTHESSTGTTNRCVRLSWDLPDPLHRRSVVTSFSVQARRSRPPTRDGTSPAANPGAVESSWEDVCSSQETTCLDPATLGATQLVAHYRVRAEGPGGTGPWCEPLQTDLPGLLAAVGNSSTDGPTDGTDVVSLTKIEGGPGRPMGPFRPGTRERESLTREVRRPRTARRPLQMAPPPPVAAAAAAAAAATASLTVPGSAAMAATVAAADHLHRRAGGSKQLLWGALASPRVARGRRAAAAAALGLGAVWAPAPCVTNGEGGGDAAVGGISEERETRQVGGNVGPSRSRSEGLGGAPRDAGVPDQLAVAGKVREEVATSRPIESGASGTLEGGENARCGRRLEEKAGAGVDVDTDGLLRRNPDCPVVTWPPSPFHPHNSSDSDARGSPKRHAHRHHQRRRRCRRQETTTKRPAG